MLILRKTDTIEEFNKNLKEGLENGIMLVDREDMNFMTELHNNLVYFFNFYISWQELKKKQK